MAEFASKGVAGAGLGLGIAGTALGLLASGTGLNSLFGGGLGTSTYATKEELSMAQELANKDHQIAALEAEKYTDSHVQAARDRESVINNTIRDMAIENEKNIALIQSTLADHSVHIEHEDKAIEELIKANADSRVREQATTDAINALATSTTDRFSAVYSAISAAKAETGAAIALEGERRVNGDQSIMSYVQANYVPGQLYMPSTSVTPTPMPAKNAWVNPECCENN